jgi:hypothetical protein
VQRFADRDVADPSAEDALAGPSGEFVSLRAEHRPGTHRRTTRVGWAHADNEVVGAIAGDMNECIIHPNDDVPVGLDAGRMLTVTGPDHPLDSVSGCLVEVGTRSSRVGRELGRAGAGLGVGLGGSWRVRGRHDGADRVGDHGLDGHGRRGLADGNAGTGARCGQPQARRHRHTSRWVHSSWAKPCDAVT